MSDSEYQLQLSSEEAMQLMELAETAIAAPNLEEFAEHALPCITSMLCSHSALLYAAESRLATPCFFQHGFQTEALPEIEELCAKQLDLFSGQAGSQPVAITPSTTWGIATNLMLYPLRDEMTCIGIIGLTPQENIAFTSTELWEKLLCLITSATKHLTERMKSDQQLNYLNSYLTVSSMLAQSLGLHELMETALYCSMEVVSAEAASVLLLDDEKNNFTEHEN